VDASATLKLLMRSFVNPGSNADNGNNCDIYSDCDHIFRFSLYHGDRCTLGILVNVDFTNLSLDAIPFKNFP